MSTPQAFITGLGHYLPERVVKNDDLPRTLNTDSEWIRKRTGIEERRYVEGRVNTSDLATAASKNALTDAGLEAKDLDCIIGATLSPNHAFPGIGVYVQHNLGLSDIPAYDIRNQCSGFLYSLSVARSFVLSGQYRKILVACAEIHSRALGKTEKHRSVASLFGDGAGSVIVSAEGHPQKGGLSVDYVKVYADGSGADKLRQRVWDTGIDPFNDWKQAAESEDDFVFAEMDGQYIFRRAVEGMAAAAKEAVTRAGLTLNDIAWVVPHQANLNINKTVATVLQMPQEKMLSNIQKYGNTTAASIPILLSETVASGKVKKGDRVLSLAFGAGLTWGAAIFTAK
jgi:3-oxoacyl-[acyl-carrier-protein] synthase-3